MDYKEVKKDIDSVNTIIRQKIESTYNSKKSLKSYINDNSRDFIRLLNSDKIITEADRIKLSNHLYNTIDCMEEGL